VSYSPLPQRCTSIDSCAALCAVSPRHYLRMYRVSDAAWGTAFKRTRRNSGSSGHRQSETYIISGAMSHSEEIAKQQPNSSDQRIENSSSLLPVFATIRESQALISRFHTVQKHLAAVEVDNTLSLQAKDTRRRALQAELQSLGGLAAYQRASLFGATAEENGAFNSGVWVHNELRVMGLLPPAHGQQRLRLLDVGALQDHWSPHAHMIEAMAIDLNPQQSSVIRADFFDFPPLPAAGSAPAFDVIVLSLVLNFVGDPRRRGVMLERCAALLPIGGVLFIVIPAACITNSRYMNHVLFLRIVQAAGFELSRHKITTKLALYALRRKVCSATDDEKAGLGCRRLCRTGRQRNNFAVLIGGEWGAATAGNRSKLKPVVKSLIN
jgi:25S rRNA (adenine2142-N1)-methyltransferase